MARLEITGRKPGLVGPPQLTVAAFTIPEFCAAHRISRTFFYELCRRGLGPDIAELLGKRIVTCEAAAAWRKKRTAEF